MNGLGIRSVWLILGDNERLNPPASAREISWIFHGLPQHASERAPGVWPMISSRLLKVLREHPLQSCGTSAGSNLYHRGGGANLILRDHEWKFALHETPRCWQQCGSAFSDWSMPRPGGMHTCLDTRSSRTSCHYGLQ